MYDYSGLINKLREHHILKTQLARTLNISSRTIAKIAKGEKLSPRVMDKLCSYFACEPRDLCRSVAQNPLIQLLADEKNHGISGGLYHELQVRMTYNSNHIEGSKLSEDQTRLIFETRTIDAQENMAVDDIIEAVNHFRAIDYCIDKAEEPLSEADIMHLHYLIKRGTQDEQLPWFNVGVYKMRPNVVGGKKTTPPAKVAHAMQTLLLDYNAHATITFEDIIAFHYAFESIHPFQDGNGRVGRLIAFKECLRHNIMPFIIEYRKKYFYYRGLNEYPHEPGFLLDTCRDGQDTFRALVDYFMH